MDPNKVKIEESWKKVLWEEFEKPYFDEISQHLHQLKNSGKTIYPPGNKIFNAFAITPFDQVKVVVLGQDPYHNPGEAMGLSFSVPRGIRIPPSLQNIYKEMHDDVAAPFPNHGDLTSWAQQGVLLLNAMLTVERNRAASHRSIGWQHFTDAVIRKLSEQGRGIVFLLWGNFAKAKRELIDTTRHFVLMASHPSPLARGAYFGSKHFSKTNELLKKQGKEPIDWTLT